jgi:hypothetical protein
VFLFPLCGTGVGTGNLGDAMVNQLWHVRKAGWLFQAELN